MVDGSGFGDEGRTVISFCAVAVYSCNHGSRRAIAGWGHARPYGPRAEARDALPVLFPLVSIVHIHPLSKQKAPRLKRLVISL